MINLYKYSTIRPLARKIVNSSQRSNSSKKTIYIAPESAKAILERAVLLDDISGNTVKVDAAGETIEINSTLTDGDVVSFVKLASRVLEVCGADLIALADNNIQREAIYRIIVEHKSEFVTLGRMAGRFEFVDKLISFMGDFMRYGIGEDEVAKAYECAVDELGDGKSTPYVDKLHDFKLLLGYMNELGEEIGMDIMANKLMLASDLLKRINDNPDLINNRRYRPLKKLLSSRFVVIGFGNTRQFTPQEMNFISLINSLGGDFDIYVLSDDSAADDRLYDVGNRVVEALTRNINGVVVHEFTSEVDECDDRIAAVASGFAHEVIPDVPGEVTDSITCMAIKNVDDRIGYIANEIVRLTREEGYRYRDIRVVCADSQIMPRFLSVMKLFGLDTFMDRKIVLANTPVFRYAGYLLLLPTTGYSLEVTLKLLRTGIAGVSPDVIDEFENFCLKNNMLYGERITDEEYYTYNENSKYRDMMVHGDKTYDTGWYLYNYLVKNIIVPIYESAEHINDGATISQKAKALAEHIDTKNKHIHYLTKELYDRGDVDRASALSRGYKELMTLLASFTMPICNIDIKQELFANLIEIDMRNKAMGTIPLKVDSVEIVSPDQAFMTECKVMFVVGASSENFPYTKVTDDILTRKELEQLSMDSGIEIPNKAENQRKGEFITAALMMGAVSDKIYWIHEKDAAASGAYTYWSQYARVLEDNCFILPTFGNVVERRHSHLSSHIPESIVKSLLTGEQRVSVSSMEMFNKCHLQYALKQTLKIDARTDNSNAQANVMGSIIHKMFETAVKDAADRLTTPEELGEYASELKMKPDELERIADNAFESYVISREGMRYMNSHDFVISSGRKAKRIFKHSFPYLLEELGQSGYVPVGYELKTNEMLPIIDTNNGLEFRFVGSIDRVDSDREGMRRIVDYKTGHKSIEYSDTLAGIQIQLFEYSNALQCCKDDDGKDIKVNDVGYFTIGLSPITNGKKGTRGLAFAQLEAEDFAAVTKYVDRVVRFGCESISLGVADGVVNEASCSSGGITACTYCPFKGSCGNNQSMLDVYTYNPGPEDIPEEDEKGKKLSKDKLALLKIKMSMEDEDNG